MDRVQEDFKTRLSKEDYETFKPAIHNFIVQYYRKGNRWRRCYGVKQAITSRTHFIFQADLYEYLKELGFKVKIDDTGDHLCQVVQKVGAWREIDKLPWFHEDFTDWQKRTKLYGETREQWEVRMNYPYWAALRKIQEKHYY